MNHENFLNLFGFKPTASFFIQLTNSIEKLKKLKDLNKLKLQTNEINIFKDEIYIISELIKSQSTAKYIGLLPFFYNKIINMKEIKKGNTKYAERIKKIFEEYDGTKKLTLKAINLKYQNLYNEKISNMTISRVLKNQLNMHYRKTKLKNPKLTEQNYILMTFLYLKLVSETLKLGLNLIFVDETGFYLNNDNLRMWRKNGEEIYGGPKDNGNQKINLIMAIDKSEIIYGQYYINSTISSNEFEDFLKELIEKMDKKKIKNSVFILDNAKYHLTKNIKHFVNDNELKFLFGVPYKSTFNAIELAFNLIKNNIYDSQFKNMKELKNKIEEIINDDIINEDIKKIYKITLEEYLKYLTENEDKYDFNTFKAKLTQRKRKRQA